MQKQFEVVSNDYLRVGKDTKDTMEVLQREKLTRKKEVDVQAQVYSRTLTVHYSRDRAPRKEIRGKSMVQSIESVRG